MYEITIKKIVREKFNNTEYQKISDSGNEKGNGPIYGYVKFEDERDRVEEIYSQKVDDLKIEEVIKAVNQIKNA